MTRATPGSAGRGILYVLIAATAWGTSGAVAAILYDTTGLGPVAVSFWRFAGGVLLLALAHAVLRRHRPVPVDHGVDRTGTRRTGPGSAAVAPRVITGVGLAIYHTAYFASVRYAGLAVATVVTLGAGPVLIALGSRLTLRERLGRAGFGAVAVALTGLILMVGGGSATMAPAPALGLACALLSALGYAVVTLLNRHLGRRGDRTRGATLAGFAIGMCCLLPLAAAEGLLPAAGELVHTVLLLGYLGAVPTALAYGLFFAGLANIRATTASVVALIEAVTAAAIAAVLFGERLTMAATAGAVVLLGAVALLAVGEPRGGAGTMVLATPVPSRRGRRAPARR